MLFCVNCGTEIQDYERFCSGCGYPAAKSNSEAAVDSHIISRAAETETVVRLYGGTGRKAERLVPVHNFKFKVRFLILPIILAAVVCFVSLIFQNRSNTFGNSFDNLKSGGTAAVQGKWIYYATDNGLYRVNLKGEKEVKIRDGRYISLNVVGDWIYCSKVEPGKNLVMVKIKLNGTKEEQLAVEGLSYAYLITATEKDIYFESEGNLYRMSNNGSEIKQIMANINTSVVNIDKNNIYISKLPGNVDYAYIYNTDAKVCSVNINGGDEKEILSGKFNPFSVNIEGRHIYYLDSAKQLTCYDATEKKKSVVTEEVMESFNMRDGWVYYISGEDRSLWKVKKNGTGKQKLVDRNIFNVNIAGSWIFYMDAIDNKYYKIRTDGTGKTELQ